MTNQLIPFANNLTPGQNLESYLRTVQTIPQLSAEEERSSRNNCIISRTWKRLAS